MKLNVVGIAKICIPALLLALGINGLIDVRLQRDMAAKSIQLTNQVHQAKTLSGELHTSVSGLGDLESTTKDMQSSLIGVQSAAYQMASGLSTLAGTVAGINQAVNTIHGSVGDSETHIAAIQREEQSILATMQQLNTVNGSVVQNLGGMISYEGQINQDLQQMNQKTAIIP